jgi:hypothetical protein
MIQSMLSSENQGKAMRHIISILEELGESFSIDVNPKDAYAEVVSTKSLLCGLSVEDVINGKRMADKRMRWTLKFLTLLCHIFYPASKSAQLCMAACRVVKLSIEHGFCSDSAEGLQLYSWGVWNFQQDVEECLKFLRAGKRLVESLGAKHMIPKVTMNVHIASYWNEPLQSRIESLKESHHELLMVGDLENLTVNAVHFGRRSLLCGRNLLTAEKECAALLHGMYQIRKMNALLPMISNHLSILKLIGSNYDSEQQLNEPLFHLLGNSEINSQDGLLKHALSKRLGGLAQQCYFDRLLIAFWSKNYGEAAHYAEKYRECHQMLHFPDMFQTFYLGISAFRLARLEDGKSREWEIVGKDALLKYQTYVKFSDWNWENKMLLLEAESYACEGELEKAKFKFRASIDSAQKHRFVHEAGLASELLGMLYEENGNEEEAMQQYAHARSCYQQWGAFALADRLCRSTASKVSI